MNTPYGNNAELQVLLQDILGTFQSQFVEGISEFEIIKLLQKPPYSLFDESALSDSLLLFQTHFVLFHSLYRLRHEWREQRVGELDISATQIQLHDCECSEAVLQVEDPLADYYLDWDNLNSTFQTDVDDLLSSFWEKMAGLDTYQQCSPAALDEALSVLGLDTVDGLSLSYLKQQYRKLQHANHPDKGGSVESSQYILEAYTKLFKYLSVQ